MVLLYHNKTRRTAVADAAIAKPIDDDECSAKDPSKCPHHGLKALSKTDEVSKDKGKGDGDGNGSSANAQAATPESTAKPETLVIPVFKNAKEGMKFLQEKLGVPEVRGFEKFSATAMRDIAQAFANATAFAGDLTSVGGLYTFAAFNKKVREEYVKAFPGANDSAAKHYAESHHCHPRDTKHTGRAVQRGELELTKDCYGIALRNDIDKISSEVWEKTRQHYKRAEGCLGIREIIAHELGHAIAYKIGANEDKEIKNKLNYLGHGRVEEQLSKYAADKMYKDWGSTSAEAIAEAWSEYTNSPSPRPLCVAIVERMRQLVEEKKAKSFTYADAKKKNEEDDRLSERIRAMLHH